MSDDFTSMGNFKGVMLCNRPAQIPGSLQTVVGPTSTSGPTRPAFVSSVVPDSQLGLPPIRHQRVAQPISKRDAKLKSEDVTWRHKKWLTEFQERRGAISASMEARVQEQAERRARFNERSQAMRDAIRGIKNSEGSKDEKAAQIEAALSGRPKYVPTEYVDVSQQYPGGAPISSERVVVEDSEEAVPVSAAVPASSRVSKPKGKAAPVKPGWARTAEEDEEFLEAEADDLLDFAAGLDYQKYIDDLEVREAIQFVKDRVKNLEESKQNAEAEEIERAKLIAAGELEEVYVVDDSVPPNEDGTPALKKIVRRVKKNRQPLQLAQHAEQWNASTAAEADGAQSERDRLAQQEALSRTVLDSNRQMRNVHSSASVRSIMEKEAKSGNSAAPTVAPVGTSATTLRKSTLTSVNENGEPFRPPVITTIHEGDQKEKKGPNPSNLPFLYRHPGI